MKRKSCESVKTNQKNKKNVKNKKQFNPKREERSEQYQVKEAAELLPFLRETLTSRSRNAIKSILTRGQVAVDGKPITQHNYELKSGQVVSIESNQSFIKEMALEGVTVLYEDDDIIVVEKEAGLLSIATNKGPELTVHRQLMNYVKQAHVNNRVYVVHRLDRDTSGVMVFARSEKVKHQLQENWNKVVLERMYTALVEGKVKRDSGTIESWLKESKTYKMYSNQTDNGGKKAITHYQLVKQNSNFSLLEVNLETGRKNQIRVHMQDLGHPIVGDKKYGATSNPMKRLGLHASTLVMIHPTTGKKMSFKSSVPKKFQKTFKH